MVRFCTVRSISTRPVLPARSARSVPEPSLVRYAVSTRTGRSPTTSSGEYDRVVVVALSEPSLVDTVDPVMWVNVPSGAMSTATDWSTRWPAVESAARTTGAAVAWPRPGRARRRP